jgi:class 3 adenylate cyclase
VHDDLRELMRDATGESQFVLALNVDIRGFSSFFTDSSQAAAYLSSAYTVMLDRYFPDLPFFQLTGDGMLVVRPYTRATLDEVVFGTVDLALALERDFSGLTDEDPLINYATPDHVGIGLSRGTATRLLSRGRTLDYSGRPLNLASRLMDLARPRGVVVDDSMFSGLDSSRYDGVLVSDSVFVQGLADRVPMRIRRTTEVTVPAGNRHAMAPT